jgi:hypothetical protein
MTAMSLTESRAIAASVPPRIEVSTHRRDTSGADADAGSLDPMGLMVAVENRQAD